MFVSDLPIVTVGGTCGRGVSENRKCELACETRGGYPANVTSYEWRFKRKFTDSFEVLSDATSKHYSIVSASYSNAGDYKCRVTHAAGGVTSDPETVEVSCKWASSVFNVKIAWCNQLRCH